MNLRFEELTHRNFPDACQIDRTDVSEDFVDTASTLLSLTDYGVVHHCIGHTFLVKYEGKAVGLILLGEAIPWETDPPQMRNEPFYRLMGFVVDKNHRNCGIGGEILELEQKGQEHKYIFGFEESCGYLKGTYARDKDAVVASMLVCELAASLKQQGKNILDALKEVYATYGYYLAYVQSIELTGSDAMEKAAKMMADLRANSPTTIGGAAVTGVRDYRTSIAKDLVTGTETAITLPKSNVLEFLLGEQGSVIARPSGTEPKVKFYYTVVAPDQVAAKALLDAMVEQMSK